MLREQTQQYIKNLSDADLIEYVREGIYEPEAITFAQGEIAHRNINAEKIRQLETVAYMHIEERKVDPVELATRPLGRKGRILAFVAGYCGAFIVPPLLAWFCFDELGQRRKKRDVWVFTLCGVGTAIFCIIASFVLDNSSLSFWFCCCLFGIGCIIMFPPKTEKDPNICATCGYDLRATPEQCPECGAVPQKTDIGKTPN